MKGKAAARLIEQWASDLQRWRAACAGLDEPPRDPARIRELAAAAGIAPGRLALVLVIDEQLRAKDGRRGDTQTKRDTPATISRTLSALARRTPRA